MTIGVVLASALMGGIATFIWVNQMAAHDDSTMWSGLGGSAMTRTCAAARLFGRHTPENLPLFMQCAHVEEIESFMGGGAQMLGVV